MQRAKAFVSLAIVAIAALSTGCMTNVRPDEPGETHAQAAEEIRADVRNMATETLSRLYREHPSAKAAVESGAGYAVFSNFGMKILIAGSGTGRGLVVDKATRKETFMRMAEVQAGLGFGIKKFRQVWVFENDAALRRFIDSGYEFGGQAALTAKAGGEGAGITGALPVSPGVWLYQLTDDGLAAEVTVKGTKYYRDDELN